ncbi:hypothetical protein PACTADRAFT_76917 [Pachysolen tannophilus NRRL Y-2460]|uniref:Golgi apparatus membrane protein TVP15 n=1 Tax=Pachysolen tannophilus NRRL Y-2460 TaxID=669874 RepID=A0A1E4TRK0_PACTA|nr:hypothetical protein PACTADRAFT_76917 [Pachysolen tannophilus NRRL Y-2460]
MDLEEVRGQDFSPVFKIVNLVIGILSTLSGVSQLLSGVQSFLLGLFIIAGGISIGFLEFKVAPQFYNYCSFFYSFIGRGIFYIFLGVLISHENILRICVGIVIIIIGIGYSILEFLPSIEPPENMQGENGLLSGVDAEDVI